MLTCATSFLFDGILMMPLLILVRASFMAVTKWQYQRRVTHRLRVLNPEVFAMARAARSGANLDAMAQLSRVLVARRVAGRLAGIKLKAARARLKARKEKEQADGTPRHLRLGEKALRDGWLDAGGGREGDSSGLVRDLERKMKRMGVTKSQLKAERKRAKKAAKAKAKAAAKLHAGLSVVPSIVARSEQPRHVLSPRAPPPGMHEAGTITLASPRRPGSPGGHPLAGRTLHHGRGSQRTMLEVLQ